MLKLRPMTDESKPRVGNLQSLISDKGFSPPVHDQPLVISILNGRVRNPTQNKARQQSSEAAGLDAHRPRSLVDARCLIVVGTKHK